MHYCTKWEGLAAVLQMTTGDIAQWIGALGTMGAAIWAAWTYHSDRQRKAREERDARALSAWRQAMMVRGVLALAKGRLSAICQQVSGSAHVEVEVENEPTWIISEADAIARFATDPTAFGLPTSKDLLEFVSLCAVANEHANQVFRQSEPHLQREIEWPEGLVDAWNRLKEKAVALYAATDGLTKNPPPH